MQHTPVVFVNCDTVQFMDLIISLDKPLETRTRNTLRALVGKHVYLAETGRGKRPLCRASVYIGHPLAVRSREDWEKYRPLACIPAGSKYDWQPGTKVKYLYPLVDVIKIHPFTPPEGIRHGRVWMELSA